VILRYHHSRILFKNLEIKTYGSNFVFFPAFSVSDCARSIVGRLLNDELKRIWKETVMTEAVSCICLEGLTKTTEHLIPAEVGTGHVAGTLERWCTD
jgi:hypothetical protein